MRTRNYNFGERTGDLERGWLQGAFETGQLMPGVDTLRATGKVGDQVLEPVKRQIILAPDPWVW